MERDITYIRAAGTVCYLAICAGGMSWAMPAPTAIAGQRFGGCLLAALCVVLMTRIAIWVVRRRAAANNAA
jgi:hypothetical protein